MTPERIAELREITKGVVWTGCDLLREALDALESAQAEIAVDAGRLRDAAMRVWGEDVHGCDTPDRLADAILGLRAQIADLKRGGVVVPDKAAWLTIDELEDVVTAVVSDLPVRGTGMPRYIAEKIARASVEKGRALRANQEGARHD